MSSSPNAADPVDLLHRMILIRQFDELAIRLRSAGKVHGVVHPYVGQEAVAVGVCAALRLSDRIVSNHRGHGHCIAKGADICRMMAELFGRVDGYCRGKGGSMHIADFAIGMIGANGVVGAGLPIATGAALAAQLDGRGDVAACFFGDGAATEGEFHEALNISAAWSLPIVFVCENNQYAANNAVSVQHRRIDIAGHAAGYGMPGVTVDGNDVEAVHEASRTAVERARRGEGPTLLECKTYRWYFHSMRQAPPPETRPADELAEWKARDPIAGFAAALVARGRIEPSAVERLTARVDGDLQAAVDFAERSPFPTAADLMTDLFAP